MPVRRKCNPKRPLGRFAVLLTGRWRAGREGGTTRQHLHGWQRILSAFGDPAAPDLVISGTVRPRLTLIPIDRATDKTDDSATTVKSQESAAS